MVVFLAPRAYGIVSLDSSSISFSLFSSAGCGTVSPSTPVLWRYPRLLCTGPTSIQLRRRLAQHFFDKGRGRLFASLSRMRGILLRTILRQYEPSSFGWTTTTLPSFVNQDDRFQSSLLSLSCGGVNHGDAFSHQLVGAHDQTQRCQGRRIVLEQHAVEDSKDTATLQVPPRRRVFGNVLATHHVIVVLDQVFFRRVRGSSLVRWECTLGQRCLVLFCSCVSSSLSSSSAYTPTS